MTNGKGGQVGPMRRKKNKSRKGKSAGNSVFNAENNSSAGDIGVIPPMWKSPNLTNQIYRVRRISDRSDANQSAGAIATFAVTFSLSSVDNATDFSNAFDLFRISLVRVKFRPRFNFAAVGTTATNIYPRLYTAIDYNSDTAPATLAEIRQYNTCKETRFDVDHVRCFRPKVGWVVENPAATISGFAVNADNDVPWVNTSTSTVVWFGLKGVIEAGAAGQTNLQSWAIEVETFFEFRMSN